MKEFNLVINLNNFLILSSDLGKLHTSLHRLLYRQPFERSPLSSKRKSYNDRLCKHMDFSKRVVDARKCFGRPFYSNGSYRDSYMDQRHFDVRRRKNNSRIDALPPNMSYVFIKGGYN